MERVIILMTNHMGCITKHFLNEFSILGVWKIEEDIDTLLDQVVTG